MRARRLALLSVLLTAACDGSTPAGAARPVFALRAVVKPALAEATARAPVAAMAPAADPEAVEAVLGTLESPDARMRGLALADAKSMGDGGVAALAAALADTAAAPARRTAAAHALGAIATPLAVDALADRLEEDREPWLRAQCAWQIRGAALDEALPRLVLRLKYETDGATVVWIADALASFGNLSGLEGLRVLRDSASDAVVRGEAAERLAALAAERGIEDGDALYRIWSRGDPEGKLPAREPGEALRREAWDRIARLGEWDLRRVDDARFVLVRMETWITPMLAAALHDEDVYTRVHAAQCLERRGARARAAVPALIEALAEPRLGPQAAAALGAIGDESAAAPVEELLRSARDPELRVAAARALGGIGSTSSRESLRTLLAPDQPMDLRQAAAGSLVSLGEGYAVAEFLLECLGSATADAGAAERDLGRWFGQRYFGTPWGTEGFAARWDALEPAAGSVPDAAQVARRRSERAAIAREALARMRESDDE